MLLIFFLSESWGLASVYTELEPDINSTYLKDLWFNDAVLLLLLLKFVSIAVRDYNELRKE
jgi:hypothetical protein